MRYFNVFGPGQEAESDYASVIPKFFLKISKDKPIQIYGDGNQTRDYIFVDDVVDANILSLKINGFSLFVIGTGREYSVNQIVDKMRKITSKFFSVEFVDLPQGDALRSVSDCSKIKKKNWTPKVDIDEGLIDTWEYFK